MKRLTITALLLLGSATYAQTVDQVAAEVDAVEVTVDQVNATATEAKGKANSLELRVTELEALPTVDPTLAATVADQGARISALETSPGGVSQAAHDALAARVAAIEANPVNVWVARDSLGTYVSAWYDRGAVGFAFIDTVAGEIRAIVNPDAIRWVGVIRDDGKPYYQSAQCGADGLPQVYRVSDWSPAVLDSGDYFAGLIAGEVVTRPDGTQYVAQVDASTVYQSGLYELRSDTGACKVVVSSGADVYPGMYAYDLPYLVPPFTVAVE